MLNGTARMPLGGSNPTDSSLTFLHEMAESLGRAIDARDPRTALHSEQVADISLILAQGMGLSGQECLTIHIAGHLHDIGKIGIPDAILLKQASLTASERLLMQQHPEIGAQIVAPVGLCATPGGIADIICHHHERYDGGGYPQGLAGDRIPLGSRIIAVADTYSALIQNRPYRPGTACEKALAEIRRCAGTQFDPVIVNAFNTIIEHGIVVPGTLLAPAAAATSPPGGYLQVGPF